MTATGRWVRSDGQGMAIAALVAAIAYAAALAGQLVYDDIHSIAANPGIRTLANSWRFFGDPTLFSSTSAMYRPVLLLSFAFDWWIGGGSVLQFKLTNVLLHALASGLVVAVARRHGVRGMAALTAALLFAAHPLASETINMVSARSEGLMVVGLLVALLGHGALLRSRSAGHAVVVCGCVIACGSKETGAIVPALLLVQEWLHTGQAPWVEVVRRWRATVVRLLPATAVVVLYLVVRRVLLGAATATLLGRVGVDPTVGATRDLATQLATMGAALPRELLRAVVPFGISIDVSIHYVRSLGSPLALLGWSAMAAWTWLGVRGGRVRPLATLGVAVAWACALPWVLIPLNVPIAEHRCYGALVGLAWVAASAGDSLWRSRWPGWVAWRRPGVVAFVVVVITFAVRSAACSWAYHDPEVLWRSALAAHPHSFRSHWGLGACLQSRGDFTAAQVELARACALSPGFRAARANWVETMLQLPDAWVFRTVVVAEELARQKDADPYYRLLHANALLRAGMVAHDGALLDAAEARVLSCLEIAPPKATVYRLAAQCRRELGDVAGALAHQDAALAAGFDTAALRAERADSLRDLGRPSEADRELRLALQMAPMDPTVRDAWQRRHAAAPR